LQKIKKKIREKYKRNWRVEEVSSYVGAWRRWWDNEWWLVFKKCSCNTPKSTSFFFLLFSFIRWSLVYVCVGVCFWHVSWESPPGKILGLDGLLSTRSFCCRFGASFSFFLFLYIHARVDTLPRLDILF
jgi:hypothetical protein